MDGPLPKMPICNYSVSAEYSVRYSAEIGFGRTLVGWLVARSAARSPDTRARPSRARVVEREAHDHENQRRRKLAFNKKQRCC